MKEWERLYSQLEDVYQDLLEEGYKPKYLQRFEKIMNQCTTNNSYDVISSMNILNNEFYQSSKEIFQKQKVWASKHEQIEMEIKEKSLHLE